MCGIFSLFVPLSASNYDTYCNLASKAMQRLKKRGPDFFTEVRHEAFIAGFHRLSINDLTNQGNQPFRSDNGDIVLMCNGEIFNFVELKEKYNLSTRTQSDCEVILRLYEKNCLNAEELNGDFAFVIYDHKKKKVILGRDRIGVRPLFYGFTENHYFAVASEMKALFFCQTDRIFHVPPAHMTIYDMNLQQVDHQAFYTIKTNIVDTPFSPARLKSLLFSATQKRLLSERPIGCLLSGGLDSSIICALLCQLIGAKNVRTYSIGMEGSVDLHYARKVATYLGTTHHEVFFTAEEGLKIIPELIYHLESYDITSVRASVGMYLLGKYIHNTTQDKVIFSGEGSDELFCGYLYFHYAPNPDAAQVESLRLLHDLYKYDVLRADRCISSHGLELRVPFLDPDVIDYVQTCPSSVKAPNGRMEKMILREAFAGMLPNEVLFRRKDGFSDGVSGVQKSWYEYIKEHVGDGKDSTKLEALWYKQIYEKHFPFYTKPIDYYWMPKWVQSCGNNPSGRVLTVFDEKKTEN